MSEEEQGRTFHYVGLSPDDWDTVLACIALTEQNHSIQGEEYNNLTARIVSQLAASDVA